MTFVFLFIILLVFYILPTLFTLGNVSFVEWFLRVGLQTTAVLIAFIPTWLFLLVKAILSPVGFWQQLLVYGAGAYFLGVIQVILCVILLAVSYSVIWSNK
jgi:hypothetical protein